MKHMSIFGSLAVFAVILVIPCKALSQEGKKKATESASLPLAVQIEVKPRMQAYMKARTQQIAELALKYEPVIEARLNKAADSGDLKTAGAFQGEKERIAALMKTLAIETKDPFIAAQRSDTLPDLPPSTQDALVGLRKIWTTEWKKIRIKLDGELQQSLEALQIKLTKAHDLENAGRILSYRESLLSGSPTITAAVADPKGTPATKEPAKKSESAMRKDLEEKLVGTKWRDRGGFIYQFEKRGKALYTAPGQPTQTWEWKVEEPGKVRFLYSSQHSIVFIYGEESESVKKEWWEGDKLLGTMTVEEIK